MKAIVAMIAALTVTVGASAGEWVTQSAKVTLIQNTTSARDAYWIWYTTTSPIDLCQGKIKYVPDNEETQMNPAAFERGFELAKDALIHDLRINIWSYSDVLDCNNAVANVELKPAAQ